MQWKNKWYPDWESLENQDEEFELNVGGTGEPLKVLEREGKFIKFAL